METNNAQTRAAGAKPTLMSSPKLSPAADEQAAEARILSNLKTEQLAHKPQSAASSGSGFKTVLLLGLVAVTAWGAYQYLFSGNAASQQAAPRAAPPAAVVAAAAAPAPPPVAEAVPAQATPPAAAPAPQAAQIVDVPAQASASEPKASDETRPAVAQEVSEKPGASVRKEAAVREAKVKAKADAQAKARDKADNLAVTASAKAKATTVAGAATAKPKTESAAKGAAPAPAPDKDVNLLAALLAHTTATEAPAPSGAARQPVMVKTGSAATTAAPPKSTVATASSLPEKTAMVGGTRSIDPKRDIVERQPTESTDTLLKRCKALGFVEGQLCRMRICSGLWETDAVCKASLTPNTASAPAVSSTNNK